ncbi:MAG: hypothetical protein EPN72_14900 [Nevskiaceae bacterium]|nr:MAG: hypothetical protein EPN72_14900 [Nevskiaceae bacterium]TBR76191.1 MAG: hypothetical protein EPN64_08830 [Burkholderiaceae bacterium]
MMSMKLPLMAALMVFVALPAPAPAVEQVEYDYLQETITRVQECFRQRQEQGQDGLTIIRCWPDTSPRKCRELGAQRANAQSEPSKKFAWNRCVMSCASAGYFSKHVGECSN